MAYQDLLKDTSKPDPSNSNYFLVTVSDLEANQSYPIQFRWKYSDGTFSPWSAVRVVTTPGESSPNTPRFVATNVDVTTPGFLKITWDGTSDDNTALTDIDRVDVYISGAPFVGNVVAATFKTAGTQSIAVPGGTYQIVLYAVSKLGKLSPVSAAVTKTIADAALPVALPENPNAPTLTAGLASVIVSWNGKQSDGTSNFSTGAFASAKVYIGTSSGFIPSDNNWVHSLNFANGTNQVSIGVGTVIDKTLGTKLQYGVPYYVKIKTVNAAVPPVETATAVASNPTNVTVDKVAASEIVTGTLEAGAYITAGISGGARAVLSGSSEPLVIYGSNGTTKLLEFSSTNPATLTVNGGGTFTGDLSAGSGSSIFKSDSSGIYLGNAAFASAPFSVSRNGILKAEAGTIGGWTLGGTYFQNASTSPTIKIDTTGIIVGATSSAYIDITSSGITHRNSNGVASGKFTLTTGASAQLTIDGTFTISGSSTINGTAASTVVSNASTGSTAIQSGNGVTKNVSNQITRISTSGGIIVSSSTASSGSRVELTNTGFYAYNGSGQATVSINAADGSASFAGEIKGSTGNIGGWNINTNGSLANSTNSTILYASLTSGGGNWPYALITERSINVEKMIQIGTTGLGLQGGTNFIYSQGGIAPGSNSVTGSPSGSDLLYSLGFSSARWDVVRAGSFLTTSDNRVKNNIEDTPLGLDFINKLRPVSFKYNLGKSLAIRNENNEIVSVEEYPGTRTHHGFIAQEVKLALNEITSNSSTDFAAWKMDDVSDPESQQALDYIEFIAPMTKAIQELSARLDALEG